MITDETSFEAALARVAAFLENPPREGTVQDFELTALLEEVAQYETQLQSLPTTSALEAIVARAHDLTRDAAALRRARDAAERPRWSSFPEDEEGIGPTTGV